MRVVGACDAYGRPQCGHAWSRAHTVPDSNRMRLSYFYVHNESAQACLLMHTRDLDWYIKTHVHRMILACPHDSTRAPTRMEPLTNIGVREATSCYTCAHALTCRTRLHSNVIIYMHMRRSTMDILYAWRSSAPLHTLGTPYSYTIL